LLTNPRGEKRTIFSCRHTYVTWALAEGLSTHMLSKQVGTGTQMMDKHYSNVSSSMNASLLIGRTRLR
jgi:integrase